MSTATPSATSTAPSPTPSNNSDNLNPETCVSLASILRCYYSNSKQPEEIYHTLLIIPVALELLFSTSLVFTNWRSGRRHLLLVAEGWVIFLLSLIEVLSFHIPAVRTQVLPFQAIDQAIGALSFTQLFFYMVFLYSWVRSECIPILPSRVRRIARLFLLLFIPAVIAMNTVASFVGVSYDPPVPGRSHVEVTFRDDRARFIWPFFSSVTLALFILFQASCFCLAFYRLMRALWIQRKLEADSEDAAVLFRGIAWINAGIKLGAIETVVGFVFFGGIPIAYVRRSLRMLSRAMLSIGVAKGIDGTEDFKAFQDELDSKASEKSRRSKLRTLISNPRFSTFRQLSPTATAFHSAPRAPRLDYGLEKSSYGEEKPHPYSASALAAIERNSQPRRNSLYAQLPSDANYPPLSTVSGGSLISPKPTTTNKGLPGMSQFAEIKAKRMSQYTQKRVTVYYHQGTPTLHLRFSTLDLPSPAVIAENIKRGSGSEIIEEYTGSFVQTENNQVKERSRIARTSRASTMPSIYSPSGELGNIYRHGSHPYGYFSSSSSSPSAEIPLSAGNRKAIYAAHGDSPSTSASYKLGPPTPGYLDSPTRRLSDFSQASNISAAHAEIVDIPRRQLSISKQRSTLARAVLYPVPSNKVVMALSGGEVGSAPSTPSKRLLENRGFSTPSSIHSSLPSSQRPSRRPSPGPATMIHSPSPSPLTNLQFSNEQAQAPSFVRDSVVSDDNYNVVTVTAISSPTDTDDYIHTDGKAKRSTRATSGYSVGSVPETLQAVRELAKQFPGLPPGAVVADIGFRASTMTPLKERDEINSISGHSHFNDDEDIAVSTVTGLASVESTDTEEMIRKRIPAEMKMKGRSFSGVPSEPLPPLPGQEIQQLPAFISGQEIQQLRPPIPSRNPKRPPLPRLPEPHQPPLPLSTQNTTTAPPPQAQTQFAVAASIDPFDDNETASYHGSQLSPLSMSVKLRHPQSFISTMYPSTRPHSGVTTRPTSGLTSPAALSYYSRNRVSGQDQSQEGVVSPGVLDFGAALKEWNVAGQNIPGIRSMRDLPGIEMVEGHRRSLSLNASIGAEFNRQQQQRRTRPDSVVFYDIEVPGELPDRVSPFQKQESAASTRASLNRIKSIGKAPRRMTPQPTRGRYVRGSTHLQPLLIPTLSTSTRDVPVSAVGTGGQQTILGVNKAGMNVNVGQEQDDTEGSGAFYSTPEGGMTSSSGGRGMGRYSAALTIEDGGRVPIKFQGSRNGSY